MITSLTIITLLLIFWKPIYWSIRYLYITLYKKQETDVLIFAADWFKTLWSLIKP